MNNEHNNVREIYCRLALNFFVVASLMGMTALMLGIASGVSGEMSPHSAALVVFAIVAAILLVVIARKACGGSQRAEAALRIGSILLLFAFPIGTILAWPVIRLRRRRKGGDS